VKRGLIAVQMAFGYLREQALIYLPEVIKRGLGPPTEPFGSDVASQSPLP